jgi:UDP-glucose 4-epimerase
MEMIIGKNILITGGTGFIGSHLAKVLSDKNNVYVLDDNDVNKIPEELPGVHYTKCNTQLINHVPEYKDIQFDLIYHLGEYSRVENSFDARERIWYGNMVGTYEVLEFVKTQNNCKLVYAGSSTKFGVDGKFLTPYTWAKATNSELVKTWSEWFGINYATVYFYNAYGGNEVDSGNYATVVGIFKRLYKEGKPLTVVKPGNQLRNFTHISDIVSGLIHVGAKGSGDNFGIGADACYSVEELAQMFNTNIEYLPERKGNRSEGVLVSNKTKELGWRPRVNLRKHIEEWLQNVQI